MREIRKATVRHARQGAAIRTLSKRDAIIESMGD